MLRKFPSLKQDIMKAHMRESPKELVKKSLVFSFYFSVAFSVFSLLIMGSMGISVYYLPFVSIGTFFLFFAFMINTPKVYIRRREREINQEVLFAGRYLLIKLEGGTPLLNVLIDASKSYGVAGKYFKEIVDDINTGTPIENALDSARRYNASKSFRLIIWQILTSLKTGAEVTKSLKSTLKQIAQEEVIEIKEYGKKLNSLVMFYMVIACVMPSLGITMLIMFSTFIGLEFSILHLFAVLFLLVVLQMTFISLIRSIRPMVNL